MAKEQRTFPREFKQEAVQLAATSEKSLTQIARDLGVAESTWSHWRKRLREEGEHAFPGSGHQPPLEEEHRRLRRENEGFGQERDSLKKAVSIFSHPLA